MYGYKINYFENDDFHHSTAGYWKGYYFKNNKNFILFANYMTVEYPLGAKAFNGINYIHIRDYDVKIHICLGKFLSLISKEDKDIFMNDYYEKVGMLIQPYGA